MKKIYSKVSTDKLIHYFMKLDDIGKGNKDFLNDKNHALQISIANSLKEGRLFKPHKHFVNELTTNSPQEIIILFEGKLKVKIYDIDDSFLGEEILESGDIYLFLEGGHGFKVMEDDTTFIELKNGPYQGSEKDKKLI